MANVKYLVIAGLVVAGVVATPLIVSKTIDSKIEANSMVLDNNGFKHTILSKSGYFTSKRTFSLEIVDAQKARDFLLDKLVEKNAQYKVFAQSLKTGKKEDVNDAFNGLTLKGEMTNSNLFPDDTKVSLALDKLPLSANKELSDNKELGGAILPLLTRGVFAIDMTIGSDEKLKDLKFRDIKEQIKIDGTALDIDTANQIVTLNEQGGVVNGVVGVGKQNLSVNSDMFVFKSQLDNFKYNFAYKDDINNKGDVEIGKYIFEMADEYSNVKFSLGAIKANSSVEDVRKDLQLKGDYVINNIAFVNETDDIKLNQLLFKLFLRGINSDTMKKLQNDYNMMVLGIGIPSDQAIIEDFVALINQGFKLDFDMAFKGLSGELNLKDVVIETKFEIAKNSYNDKQSPLAIINLLNVTAKVKMHKDDQKTLEALSLVSSEDVANGKVEGDFVIYELVMKEGAVSINGKAMQ